MEKHFAGVLHNARSYRTDILLNTSRTLRLGSLIQRKKLTRCWWKLIRCDSTFNENAFRDCDCRHGIRPAGIEREMRDDVRNLTWLDAVIEGKVEVVWHLDRLISSDQRGYGNNAAISWR